MTRERPVLMRAPEQIVPQIVPQAAETLPSLLRGIAQMSFETVTQMMLSPAFAKEWK